MRIIIRDPVEMESWAPAWNEMAERFKTPLLRHELLAACAEAFCLPGQLHVVMQKSGKGIGAIAPLAFVRKRGWERLELLGSSFLSEPGGFLYRDAESLRDLMLGLMKDGKPMLLSRLGEDSGEVGMLREMNKKRALVVARTETGSPYLPLTTNWAAFEAALSSRDRYDLRRAGKRAERSGKIQFEIANPGPETVDRYLEEIYRVEAAGWKGRQGTALLADERLKRFFNLYAKAASRQGALRLCFLRINDRAVAVQLAAEYYKRFWVFKIGYDEAFSRCSPGILLMHETIRYAFEQGLEAYEFLGFDAPWMHRWTEQKHSHITARIYPFSLRGQLRLGRDAAVSVVNKAFRMAGI
jgi:CelD/BcsL family acetyltransferase involved in cellulose biosynthesis